MLSNAILTLPRMQILLLYEAVMYTSGAGFLHHAGGAGKLIEMRGPERHQEYPEHGYFILARGMILGQSIMTRKRSFLEKEEWMTIPWSIHPETRNAHHKLLEITAPVPGLMEDYQKLESVANDKTDLLALSARLIPKLEGIMQRIIRWRWEWEVSSEPKASEAPVDLKTSWTLKEDGTPLYPTVYHFTDIGHVHEFMLYNTCVSVLMILAHLSGAPGLWVSAYNALPSAESPPKINPFPLPHAAQDIAENVNGIARCVDFCLREDQARQGAFSLIFPLRTCVVGFSMLNELEKVRWVIKVSKVCLAGSKYVQSRIQGERLELPFNQIIEPVRHVPTVLNSFENQS